MPPKSPNHAIVYGASGLIGWALINQLLSPYPAAGTFQKVTAVTNRPLDASGTYWPEADLNRPQLQLASGVDLRSWDRVRLVKWLREVVENSEGVTHVYYLAFAAMDDDLEEVATNRRMLQNVIDAHNLISPKLQFVAFVGGTRGYGIYSAGGTFTPPLREELVNSLPSDYAKTVVYPAYREILRTSSKGRKWTWCEVCPDAIVGFTPNGSQFSLALHWAQYLSLYAYNHGIGPHNQGKEEATKASVEVPFPGSTAGATSLFSPVSSSRLARFMIFASLHPEMCGDGRLFNVADRATPCTYGSLWPTGGVGVGYRQLDSVGYWLTFDRQLSVERLRDTGFEGDQDPVEGWLESFAMFRRAGLIL